MWRKKRKRKDDWMTDHVLTNDHTGLDHILIKKKKNHCKHVMRTLQENDDLLQWINRQLYDLHSCSSGLRGSCLPLCVVSTVSVA